MPPAKAATNSTTKNQLCILYFGVLPLALLPRSKTPKESNKKLALTGTGGPNYKPLKLPNPPAMGSIASSFRNARRQQIRK
jgi:hypothetical protein